eukprot:XP_016664800.1 PREDICTED: uncharacterized protein LOC107885636 [Acyrthosiphon pisum]
MTKDHKNRCPYSNVHEYTYRAHDSELTAPFHQEPLPPRNVVGETVALETDNVEVRVNTDDSGVESLSHYFRSIDLLNSASMDQPSASSGIRGSLNRPINRRRRTSSSESAYVGLPRISFQPQVRRGNPN